MSPTNPLRQRAAPAAKAASASRRAREPREVLIRAGFLALRARLTSSPTADRIWAALPIYATAETWGQALHFETHARTGREATARDVVQSGEIAFWAEEDRIVIAWAPTPVSRAGEIRLPALCNVWAVALDDVSPLAAVQPGERVAVLVAES
jgi:hypothetical protein